MGYIAHDAVIVTANGYPWEAAPGMIQGPDVDAFRGEMPSELRHLVVGPFKSVVNDYVTFVFCPDGSNEGWELSDTVDEWRRRFIDLFSQRHKDGSSPFAVVHIHYGGDYGKEYGTYATTIGRNV